MNITITKAEGKVPVSILQIHGNVDGSNYTDLIDAVKQLVKDGTKDVLLDLSDVPFLSSAGIVALHNIAKMLRGQEAGKKEEGWDAFRAIDKERDKGAQKHLKLLNPSAKVDSVLTMAGLKDFLEIYTDRDQAIASY